MSNKNFVIGLSYPRGDINSAANPMSIVGGESDYTEYRCLGYLGGRQYPTSGTDIIYSLYSDVYTWQYLGVVNLTKRRVMFCVTDKGLLVFERDWNE